MKWVLLSLLILGSSPASAGGFSWDRHPELFQARPTEAEVRSACTADARRLCAKGGHDSDSILACFKVNRNKLSPGCSTVLTALGQ